nr:MAG TPA: hypothetical protein [Caudoviricetes sp.]
MIDSHSLRPLYPFSQGLIHQDSLLIQFPFSSQDNPSCFHFWNPILWEYIKTKILNPPNESRLSANISLSNLTESQSIYT